MKNQTDQLIAQFFSDLLGYDPDIIIEHNENEISVQLNLDAQESGVVIGYRGEVLTSLQLILSLMVQPNYDIWFPVRLNVNDYRQQRNKALETLALNTASKALEFNKSIRLNNLSSYERRIIHSILSENDQIETHSEGEPQYRVLVVTPISQASHKIQTA